MEEFRTTFTIPRSEKKITYNDPIMFIGSCFAASIGRKLESGRMPVMINPSGTVFNPVSVCHTLRTITSGEKYKASDLFNFNGKWISFNHYTDFSSENPGEALEKINSKIGEAGNFISKARYLFITFGTARVYRWKASGKIVSNCHKMPSTEFTNELLSVNEIVSSWNQELTKMRELYPALQVIFTVSPVRHMNDGAHGNQVSKSVLFVAIEELLSHPSGPGYFPAYELLMDDLRDYRFYNEDMIHPSDAAIDYIWRAFSDHFFDDSTKRLWKEVTAITRSLSHRIQTTSKKEILQFANAILSRIDELKKNHPEVNMDAERTYFENLSGIRK